MLLIKLTGEQNADVIVNPNHIVRIENQCGNGSVSWSVISFSDGRVKIVKGRAADLMEAINRSWP